MLSTLDVVDFRCVQSAHIELHPTSTLICGSNGSGKSSLLEAIYILGRGKSFRTHTLNPLVRHGATAFRVVARVVVPGGREIIIGIEASEQRTVLHVDGHRSRGFAVLARTLPVSVIDPEVHQLLEDGPSVRRRFLDWGVFHVEPNFVGEWRSFQRALKQRNAALKAKSPATLVRTWDSELIRAGMRVNDHRHRYVELLRPYFADIARDMLDFEVTVDYEQGWRRGDSLESVLKNSWPQDHRLGTTTTGPHRAELTVKVDGHLAKTVISRGQQKLLASAMLMAQLRLNSAESGEAGCLLLDDPAAELDVDNLAKFFKQVTKTQAQIVATALQPDKVSPYFQGKKFHVEQGKVSQLL
jgi:DNA replication and repair protein RecF